MAFCPSCGAQLPDNASFCQYCGTRIAAAPAAVFPQQPNGGAADISVMLLSKGTCTKSRAISLIANLCGYTKVDAKSLTENVPIVVAEGLTEAQAAALALALTESGMDVTLFNSAGYCEAVSAADACSDIRPIGPANRISRARIRPMNYPFRFTGVHPPIFRMPESQHASAPARRSGGKD